MNFQGDLAASRDEHEGRVGEIKVRCLRMCPHWWERLFCLNPLVLFCNRERLPVSPLGIADVPGFLSQCSALDTIINYLWETGEKYLLQLQRGSEKLPVNENGYFPRREHIFKWWLLFLLLSFREKGQEHSGDAVRKSRQLSAAGSFTGRNLRVYNIELKLASNSLCDPA